MLTEDAAYDDAYILAVAGHDRQLGLVAVGEARVDLLVSGGHRHPALPAMLGPAPRAAPRRRALRMDNAPGGRPPVEPPLAGSAGQCRGYRGARSRRRTRRSRWQVRYVDAAVRQSLGLRLARLARKGRRR